jgi:putative DNA primase/helicase
MAGYRQKGGHETDPMVFYTFPAAFEGEIARGFNTRQFAEVLKKAGMLTPPTSGRGFQRKSPRIDGRQFGFMSCSICRTMTSQSKSIFSCV